MIRRSLARLAAMDAAELQWRGAAAARQLADRARFAVARPRWNRADLARRLDRLLVDVSDLVRRERFDEAHRALSSHFVHAPQRFVIGAGVHSALADRIATTFPTAARDAAARADALLFGSYDLLGFRGLRFDAAGSFDWHSDPVHGRRAPRGFWASVPFLDPACGDHKIIWELNRHQHWLALGRAFWLTGEHRYRDRAVAELASWLEANPPLDGINWASMLELAFRSLSWIWALHFFADPQAQDRLPWTVDLLLALDRQLTHVEQNLSHYFSPNTHLLGEALALYVAGRSVPALAAARRRADIGRRILLAEIGRQILPDGGHCERSAYYHRYTLDFYLLASTIARITNDPALGIFDRAVARLASAARLLADDGGRLPHIGDDDGGMLMPVTGRDPFDARDSLASAAALLDRDDLRVDGPCEETLWLLAHPVFTSPCKSQIPNRQSHPRSAALPDTGYYVSRWRDGTHAVIDGGRHGYQNGGHAHADALSVALRLEGMPLVVDPGTPCYTIDPAARDRFRSSAMHNTLTIDGRSQSAPAGPFHWSHTADATVARWRVGDAFDYFEGSHDGYSPLVHRRHVLALHGDLVIVADFVHGEGAHAAAVHWHLDPRWTAAAAGGLVQLSASRRAQIFAPRGELTVVQGDADGLGWFAPAYGRVERATTIRIVHQAPAPFWIVTAFDCGAAQNVRAVDVVPVWAEARTLARSIGLRIARESSIDYVLVAEPEAAGACTTWRIAEFETDARMIYLRTVGERQVSYVAMVDGSTVRSAARHGLHLALPRVAAAFERRFESGAASRSGGPEIFTREPLCAESQDS